MNKPVIHRHCYRYVISSADAKGRLRVDKRFHRESAERLFRARAIAYGAVTLATVGAGAEIIAMSLGCKGTTL